MFGSSRCNTLQQPLFHYFLSTQRGDIPGPQCCFLITCQTVVFYISYLPLQARPDWAHRNCEGCTQVDARTVRHSTFSSNPDRVAKASEVSLRTQHFPKYIRIFQQFFFKTSIFFYLNFHPIKILVLILKDGLVCTPQFMIWHISLSDSLVGLQHSLSFHKSSGSGTHAHLHLFYKELPKDLGHSRLFTGSSSALVFSFY
jgi:hypothetical protein